MRIRKVQWSVSVGENDDVDIQVEQNLCYISGKFKKIFLYKPGSKSSNPSPLFRKANKNSLW